MMRTKNKAREKCLNKETKIPIDNYREARRNAKKLLRRKKREFLREKLKSIEKERLDRVPREFYKEIKNAKTEFKPQCKFIRTLSGELVTSQEEII